MFLICESIGSSSSRDEDRPITVALAESLLAAATKTAGMGVTGAGALATGGSLDSEGASGFMPD
jgi:hypothetical protein